MRSRNQKHLIKMCAADLMDHGKIIIVTVAFTAIRKAYNRNAPDIICKFGFPHFVRIISKLQNLRSELHHWRYCSEFTVKAIDNLYMVQFNCTLRDFTYTVGRHWAWKSTWELHRLCHGAFTTTSHSIAAGLVTQWLLMTNHVSKRTAFISHIF